MAEALIQSEELAIEQYEGIPIRNIWLLMLYASDLFKHMGQRDNVLPEDNLDDIPELVAGLLVRTVDKRLRRNLTHGYLPIHAVVSRVRGRIDHLETAAKQLLSRGVIACEFEHFTADTPRNQFVRAALDAMAAILRPKSDIAHDCRKLSRRMEQLGVSRARPSRSMIATERFARHDADDRLMVDLATLAFDLTIPTRQAGPRRIDFGHGDKYWLRRLFEKAIGGFYDVELSRQGWKVETGTKLSWPLMGDCDASGLFPSMRLDIALTSPAKHRTVIDTKFTSILSKKSEYYGGGFKSDHLYQLYTYLRTQEEHSESHRQASGMLLYPCKGEVADEMVEIQGHHIRMATVDLSGPTGDIRKRLLEIADCF